MHCLFCFPESSSDFPLFGCIMKTIESQPPKLKYMYIYIYPLKPMVQSRISSHLFTLESHIVLNITEMNRIRSHPFFHPCYSPVLLVKPEWTKTYTYFGKHIYIPAIVQSPRVPWPAIKPSTRPRSWGLETSTTGSRGAWFTSIHSKSVGRTWLIHWTTRKMAEDWSRVLIWLVFLNISKYRGYISLYHVIS